MERRIEAEVLRCETMLRVWMSTFYTERQRHNDDSIGQMDGRCGGRDQWPQKSGKCFPPAMVASSYNAQHLRENKFLIQEAAFHIKNCLLLLPHFANR